ncbi:hypothetical protein [Mycoplasmopsis alligatoris]|uniref:Replicative helicase loading/DNA remodeling protein DnaB N-terminal winged helix domain-containing protein n=1 Tax=Mycoplasmopsis alligatoris A21JP2 TaxID=747682 RepID=D4XW49_9BACT|nr:hypothetical protein [Mycoplasmopsis alligatoris]EFF41428.1 hypothetical protein MALL_0728 [Mycoplasmopsis alligatoris A21JP2]
MNKIVRYPFFIIEKDNLINNEDLSNLRKFYLPFLGSNTIVLYEYLKDLSSNVTRYISPYDLTSLSLYLGMSSQEVEKARILLESVSLLNTYQNDEEAKTVFVLQKPLNNETFKKNPLLSVHLKNKIGTQNYNRLVGNLIVQKNRKYYEEISANYFDVFDIQEDKNAENALTKLFIEAGKQLKSKEEENAMMKSVKFQNTLNLENNEYTNLYEAALKLSSPSFFVQLLKRDATDEEKEKIELWECKLLNQQMVNIVLLLSFYINDRLSLRHTDSLVNEIANRKIDNLEDCEAYLDNKFENGYSASAFKKKYLLKISYLEGLRNDQ